MLLILYSQKGFIVGIVTIFDNFAFLIIFLELFFKYYKFWRQNLMSNSKVSSEIILFYNYLVRIYKGSKITQYPAINIGYSIFFKKSRSYLTTGRIIVFNFLNTSKNWTN